MLINNLVGGGWIRYDVKLFMLLMIFCCLISVSCISATNLNETNVTVTDCLVSDVSILTVEEESPDEPDLVLNDTIYVESNNYDDYFTNGVLTSEFEGKTFIFNQDFENLGQISIRANNVTIKGMGYTLKNTVFQISARNVTLSDVNLELDSEFSNNDGSAVVIFSDYVDLINLHINYIVPKNVEAYGIYAMGDRYNPLRNLKIKNSHVNFEGHNDDVDVYNCALKLEYCHDSIIENNTIMSALPLKDIIFGPNGAELASDLVLTVGIGACSNITFVNNHLFSEVNKRPENRYPSLDCMLISKTDNSLICNNSIFMTDFLTYPGTDNYLYGLDIYDLNNLTVCHNNISIITTGGKLAAGTAYPIQITGPISNVNITENDLYSFSNGPNIGIYSQNFFGATTLSITNNKINVTGLAGTHEWALVAGIESQDSHSIIVNNTIEVHSVGAVGVDDNIYGISYRQSTSGNHQYDIENNIVFSDGFYAVNLLSSVNSKILNNLLVSYNSKAQNGYNGFKYWNLNSHDALEFYNNQVIRAFDYFALNNNHIDNGDSNDYSTPKNNEDIPNNIDGSKISGDKSENKYSYNPLIPGDSKEYSQNYNHETQDGNDNVDVEDEKSEEDDSSGNSARKSISLKDFLINFINSNTEGEHADTTSHNGKNVNTNSYSGKNVTNPSNESDSTPSTEGKSSAESQFKSSSGVVSSTGESESVSKKIFEIEEKNEEKFIPSIFFIIPVMILFIIGIRRRKPKFD